VGGAAKGFPFPLNALRWHHGLAWLFTHSHGKEHTMNPTQCDHPSALFAACMHAGGWPKLGFQCQDDAEEVLSCYDDIILL